MTSPESHMDDYDQDDDCANCGGGGYVYDCFDGFCEDAESGCDDCARRCDWCNRPTKKQTEDRAALGEILSDALGKPPKPDPAPTCETCRFWDKPEWAPQWNRPYQCEGPKKKGDKWAHESCRQHQPKQKEE